MVYVHVPFCRSFCTYCDFYSERACPSRSWVDEVCREARSRRDEIAATAAVDTLYFGGGTPSVLPLEYLGLIADACGGRNYAEWTVEVNPDDITPEYARGLRALGVNRVSMGVQSLDDGMLRWMNRRHSADGARRAFRLLRDAGFDNISVDVIFGISGLTTSMLESTLKEILDWRPEHISAYQLSVEEGSALADLVRKGRYTDLPDEECSAQYYLICRLLEDAGHEHYEISNWARPGFRAIHNSAYWTRAPYVGLGPGAHSLSRTGVSEVRSWNSECLSGWTPESEVLTEEQIREERIMLGLRTAEGIPGYGRIPEDKWFVADSIIAGLV
ncbi:MAG: radical SAM family heme chaperone HemW [Bacteroidales bacterium]|nr:radical SAM family heme chaperone HemW [Bacteroidales bacterium]